jgi:DNA-binding response OmpR family regulator
VRILIIEDEIKVVSFLKEGLEEHGFDVDFAYEGLVGEHKITENGYDLVILDVKLPDINGFDLCKRVKEVKPNLPVLMLTALGTTDDKLTGFDSGTDDYLVKPFDFKELVARVRALLKRSVNFSQTVNKLVVADLELDMKTKLAKRGGKTIELTAKEYALLEFLMKNVNTVVSRIEIAESVWDIGFDTGTNTIDVYINILRKKVDHGFDTKLIHTKIGMGYILVS